MQGVTLHAVGPNGENVPLSAGISGALSTGAPVDSAASKLTQTFYYSVLAAFPGASVNDTLLKTVITDYSAQPVNTTTIWLNVTTSSALASPPNLSDIAAVVSNPLTDLQLRAAAVPVSDPEVRAKLDLLLAALTGDPASLAALTEQQIALLTQLGQYNDGVETLLSSIGNNTDALETLLTQLGLNTDQVESIMAAVRDRLPAALGPQPAALSLSMVLAGDHPPLRVVADAPLATAAGVAEVKAAVDAVTAKLIAAPATDATLAAVSDKLPATLGQKSKAESLAVTLPTDQTIPVTGPLTAAQLGAAALATDATALAALSPSGWRENAAGEITAVSRRLPNGQLQEYTLTKDPDGAGGFVYTPGQWQNVGVA